MIWKPNVTVAAIVEQNQRFLLVEESVNGRVVFNQPAGHLEFGETLQEAVQREVFEETAYRFLPENLLGIYLWSPPHTNISYVRFAFIGAVTHHEPSTRLDDGIIRACWLSLAEIKSCAAQHRSPQVLACIEDYLAGQVYPLTLLRDL